MGRQIFEIWPTSQNLVLWGGGRGKGGSETLREVSSSVSGKNPLTPFMCIYLCTYIATKKIYLYLWMWKYVYVLMIWSCTYTIGSCINMYMYIDTAGVYLYICISLYRYIYVCVHIYAHRCFDDTYICVHIHIFICILKLTGVVGKSKCGMKSCKQPATRRKFEYIHMHILTAREGGGK